MTPEHAASFTGDWIKRDFLTVRIIGGAAQSTSIVGAALSEDNFIIRFTGEPAVTAWKIIGSLDLESYSDDLSAEAEITETTPGVYEAVIDVSKMSRKYFFRVER